MTTYLEKLLRWLYPGGNWGLEGSDDPSQVREWGRLWVHVFLGCFFSVPCFVFAHFFGSWGLISLLLPAFLPFFREFVVDGHPLKDLWIDTPAGIDCRSDILSCLVGSATAVPFIVAVTL